MDPNAAHERTLALCRELRPNLPLVKGHDEVWMAIARLRVRAELLRGIPREVPVVVEDQPTGDA